MRYFRCIKCREEFAAEQEPEFHGLRKNGRNCSGEAIELDEYPEVGSINADPALYGYGVLPVYECRTCGALVLNVDKHDEFHRSAVSHEVTEATA